MKMNIIRLFSTIFLALVVTGCSVKDFQNINEEKKEFVYERPAISAELLTTINTILKNFEEDKLHIINAQYVHPTFGFYEMFKVEGEKTFSHKYIIDYKNIENNSFVDSLSRVTKKDISSNINQDDVVFQCSPNNDEYYGWNKEGIYLNSNTNIGLLDQMIFKNSQIKKDETALYMEKDFHNAKLIEKTSYQVVLTPEVIFYLNKIENKWYITFIDRVTTDCSVKKVKKIKKKKGSK